MSSLRIRIAALLQITLAVATRAPEQQTSAAPPWRFHLMPWLSHAGQVRPWRVDRRLEAYREPGYPDDAIVLFLNPDSLAGGRHEGMWLTITAYDSATDLFLGILIDQPSYIKSVKHWDNVAFRLDTAVHSLIAIAQNNSYEAAAWPATRVPAFRAGLLDGIRAYRDGGNGHNMPGIDRCIQLLAPMLRAIPPGASSEEQFVGHYVLGRCLAEKYETQLAAGEFRAAISLDSTDMDAHMALLAELSVMTHDLGKGSPTQDTSWEQALLDELGIVRTRFGNEPGVHETLDFVFDPALEAQVAPEWRPYIPKLRRIGYAVFRWKVR